MIVITATGSRYEINQDTKQIRRLSGRSNLVSRVGKDGEWKHYDAITPIVPQVGNSLVIWWGSDVNLLPETKAMDTYAVPTTWTSPVIEVQTDCDEYGWVNDNDNL